MPAKKKNSGFQEVVEQKIDAYLNERFGLARAKADKTRIGLAFSEFCVKEILAPFHEFSDDDQIESGLRCDGPRDLGIDFIYRNEDSYHILQVKYKGEAGNLSPDEVGHFLGIDGRIFSPALKEANDEVQDLLDEIKPTSSVEYSLVTNGRLSEPLLREFERRKRELSERETAEWRILDGEDLRKKFTRSPSVDDAVPALVRIPVRALDGKFGRLPCCIDLSSSLTQDNGLHETIVTVVTGSEIKALHEKEGNNLFHANIRGYLGGKNKVNEGLIKTLKHEPREFYLFNNGISALCDGMKIVQSPNGGGVVECTGFQIINGAQTAATIGKFRNPDDLDKVNVLLRVTRLGDAENELRQRIIQHNNSQNVVRHSDFRANDAIQRFLAQEFGKAVYKSPPKCKVEYIPKRGMSTPAKPAKSITMETLAKALYAYSEEDKPSFLYSQSKFLFSVERNTEGKYWDLFGDGDGGEAEFWTAKYTRKVIAIAFLQIFLEKRLKEQRREFERKEGGRDTVQYMSYCMRWHILWSFGTVIRLFHAGREDDIYKSIVDGDGLSDNGFVARWFGGIERIIQDILSDEQSETGLNFKLWLRSGKKVEKIKGRIESRKSEFPLP